MFFRFTVELSASSEANSRSMKEEMSFLKPEGSSRCSQQIASGPHPERDETSEYYQIPID
jgi:hypothetical protein